MDINYFQVMFWAISEESLRLILGEVAECAAEHRPHLIAGLESRHSVPPSATHLFGFAHLARLERGRRWAQGSGSGANLRAQVQGPVSEDQRRGQARVGVLSIMARDHVALAMALAVAITLSVFLLIRRPASSHSA